MDNTKSLIDMMTSRIATLHRQAAKLNRMATFSTCARERRVLRDESKTLKNKAAMLQARVNKLGDIASVTVQKDVLNG